MKNESLEKDAFGNHSSTRKLRRQIVYFTLVMIAVMVLPVAVRIAINGLDGLSMDYSIMIFLLSLILILFTAGFAPAAFAQSKEWTAFIAGNKK